MDRRKFRYVVLRYVPDPVRNEPINVGILLQDVESGRVAVRLPNNLEWLERLPKGTETTILSWILESLRDEVEDNMLGQLKYGTEDFFVNVSRKYRNQLQLGTPQPVLGESELELQDRLYAMYVGEMHEASKVRGYGQHQLRAALRRVFQRQQLLGNVIREGVKFRGSDMPEVEVDFAYRNGKPNIIQPISLDVKEDERKEELAKIWSFNFQQIVAGEGLPKDSITAVVYPPHNQHTAIFRTATEVLQKNCGYLVIHDDKSIVDLVARVQAIAHPWES